LVVDVVFLEGRERLAVEGAWGSSADHHDVALVELEADMAADLALALVDRGLQHQAFGAEPKAVVDELGIARHELVF